MTYPNELLYTKSHEWLKEADGIAEVGISEFAQDALGDVVFINLPEVGDEVVAGEAFGDVESVKAVSDLQSPVSGIVCDGAWIIRVKDVTDKEELMDADAYEAFCAEEG